MDPASTPDHNTEFSGTLMGLGIYMHVLADRVSHFRCSEYSFISPAGRNHYTVAFPEAHCGQIEHALMHYDETGHVPVPARPTLTQDYFYREVLQWLAAHPQYRQHPPLVMAPGQPPIDYAGLRAQITAATGIGGAAERLSAMCRTATAFGLGWHDGNTACDYLATP